MSVVVLGEPIRGTSLEIINSISSSVTALNVGSGAGIYKQQIAGVIQLKSLVAGAGITVTPNTDDITIASSGVTITANKAAVSNGSGLVIASTTSDVQIGYLDTLTSNAQTQFNTLTAAVATKEPIVIGAATTITALNLSADKALISTGGGKVAVSNTTATELSYVSGATSSLQSQINTIAALAATGITNPLTSTLVVPNPYGISFNSGNLLISASGINIYDSASVSSAGGNFIANVGVVYAGGGISTGADYLKWKIFPINDWNMDSTLQKFVTLTGISRDKIRSIDVVIRIDGGAQIHPLNRVDAAGTLAGSWDFVNVSNDLSLTRVTGGYFDNTSFDQTSFNRGYVTVQYTL